MPTQHRLELARVKKVNSRNNVPIVEGAYTRSNNVLIPPLRSKSTSSMLSAPEHIPAINVASFGAEFAAPDFIRGPLITTVFASASTSPVCSATASPFAPQPAW